jgi:hypothetical protein
MATETKVTAPETTVTETASAEIKDILLEGQSVYGVQFVEAGLSYKKGQRKEDKKTYSRYTYKGIAFSVPTEHPFNLDFLNGQVKSLNLLGETRDITTQDENGNDVVTPRETLQFSAYLNRSQWKALQEDRMDDAKVEATIARYAHFAKAPITADFLNELAKA